MDNELSLVKNSIFVSSVQRPVRFVLSSILLYNLGSALLSFERLVFLNMIYQNLLNSNKYPLKYIEFQ